MIASYHYPTANDVHSGDGTQFARRFSRLPGEDTLCWSARGDLAH
jgi:hypothetical protein